MYCWAKVGHQAKESANAIQAVCGPKWCLPLAPGLYIGACVVICSRGVNRRGPGRWPALPCHIDHQSHWPREGPALCWGWQTCRQQYLCGRQAALPAFADHVPVNVSTRPKPQIGAAHAHTCLDKLVHEATALRGDGCRHCAVAPQMGGCDWLDPRPNQHSHARINVYQKSHNTLALHLTGVILKVWG